MKAHELIKDTIFKIIDGNLVMEVPNKQYYPYGTDEYQYPRTIKPITSITSSRIITNVMDIDNLILNGVPVNDITWDKRDNDIMSLVTAKALSDSVKEIYNKIDEIDPHHILYQDNSVVSLPITDTTFNSNFWDYENWDVSRGSHAIFKGTGKLVDRTNYLTLKGYPFNRIGTYFINIEISNLDSGRLVVYDSSHNELGRSIVPGRFGVLYNLIYPDNANIRIQAEDVLNNEYISISSVSIYYVTNRIQEYLDYIVPHILTGGDGDFASTGFVHRSLEAMKIYLEEQISQLPTSNSLIALVGHIRDRTSNPHGITAAMIEAAPENHTHHPEDLDPPAALKTHSHIPIDIGAADRSHTHSPEEIGAAREIHTHSPNECGAAPEVHEHEQYVTRDEISGISSSISGSSNSKVSYPIMTRVDGSYVQNPYTADMSNMHITKPLCHTRTFCHVAMDDYDPVMGYAYTDHALVQDPSTNTMSYPWHGFFTCKQNEHTFATFSNTSNDVTDMISIGYRFNISRRINTYTIYRRDVAVYPKSWVINSNKGLLSMESDVLWSDDEFSKTFTIVPDTSDPNNTEILYGTPVTDIKFTFTEIAYADSTTPFTVRFDMTFNTGTGPIDQNTVLAIIYNNNKVSLSDNTGNVILQLIEKNSTIDIKTEDLTNYMMYDMFYPYIQQNGDEVIYSYETFPPEYGYSRTGIPIFANKRISGMYGFLSTVEDISDPDPYINTVQNIYTYPMCYDDVSKIPVFETESGTDSISIYHRNIPKLNLLGWKCFIRNQDVINNTAPTEIEIHYSRSEYGYNFGTPIPETDIYGNEIVDGEINDAGVLTYTAKMRRYTLTHKVTSSGIDDTNGVFLSTPIINITSLEYKIGNMRSSGTAPTDKISIVGICPYFTNEFYDIGSNIMYDKNNDFIAKKTYIGIIEMLYKNNGDVLPYTHPFPIGTMIDLPLDVNLEEYTAISIPNMFFTNYISVEPIDTEKKTVSIDNVSNDVANITAIITPSVKIKDITPERISMIVHGVRGIRIRRLW